MRSATSVPKCSATSKARPGSGQPRNQGRRMRCAVLDIGRNSVRPCTAPKMIAWKIFIDASFSRGGSVAVAERRKSVATADEMVYERPPAAYGGSPPHGGGE